ncbi:MAG: hypothetical protein HXX17_08700 [Geobacteraceae bacterium]|nr:hypothetical protein [Geobacteraceae bacterium]
MKRISVFGLLLLLFLAACTPFMYGVPQANWDRMSETERVEAMRIYERNEQARRKAAEEMARTRAIEEQTRRLAAEERARHEEREHQAASERQQRERELAIRDSRGTHEHLITPFISGKTLRWETDALGGQNGTIHVTSTEGSTFYLDQRNNKNTAAGVVKLDGMFKDGNVIINNRKWGETWVGTVNNGVISGKINNKYAFLIFDKPEASVTIKERAHHLPALFVSGKTLRWETDALGGQNGTIDVTSTEGSTFYMDQRNYKNRAAGVVKLDGTFKDGNIIINNRKWGETWVGTMSNGGVYGKINNTYNFRLFE